MSNTNPARPTTHMPFRLDDFLQRYPRVIALAAVVGLGLGLTSAGAQGADLDELRDQREQARAAELEARTAFDALDAEFEDVEAALEAADQLVREAEARAASIESKLEVVELRLARTEVGLAWADYDRETLSEGISELAINQYLNLSEDTGLLGEADPAEAMRRNTVLDAVQGAGYDVLADARSAADQFEELRTQAEADRAVINELTLELELELAELEAAREVRERARDTLDGRRQQWLSRIDDLERQEADFTDQIRAEQRRRDAEAARAAGLAAAADRFDADASAQGYIWPTAGGIGSYFGPRRHPVLGITRLHGGLDIGGRMGQPIWASKEGTVILAGVNGGYGNTIVIDHGNGYASLYGHMSQFAVSKGTEVETGQQIGSVGSTGLSTGPHLHFEIRIDGSVVDPLPYLPPR